MYYTNPVLNNGIVSILDHLNGFDQNYYCEELDKTVNFAKKNNCKTVHTAYVLPLKIKNRYDKINFYYNENLIGGNGWKTLVQYDQTNKINYKNFLCSFNGSPHVGRLLLISILKKFDYFNKDYCSKTFSIDLKTIDCHIINLIPEEERFYQKFFSLNTDNEDFFNKIIKFKYNRFNHIQNIKNLDTKINESFLHLVSETISTSYVPFITEKFLYSIVTKGLFLTNGQVNWHQHLEKFYGFKQYNKIFDYRFDSIENPVIRLVELMTMISKFKNLTPHEWHDLYLLEKDTIEYNYDHYYSKSYLKNLANLEI